MVNAGKKVAGSLRPDNLRLIRAISRDLNLSHPTVLTILHDPEKEVSRKTMLKVIRATTRRKRRTGIQPLNLAGRSDV